VVYIRLLSSLCGQPAILIRPLGMLTLAVPLRSFVGGDHIPQDPKTLKIKLLYLVLDNGF